MNPLFKQLNKLDLAPSSIKLYSKTLDMLFKDLQKADTRFKGKSIAPFKHILRIEDVMDSRTRLDTKTGGQKPSPASLATKMTAFKAIVNIIKKKKGIWIGITEEYIKRITEIFNEVENKRMEQQKSADDLKKWLSWEELQDIPNTIVGAIDALPLKTRNYNNRIFNLYQFWALSLLYLKSDYLPRLDYHSMVVITTRTQLDKNVNQLLVNKKGITVFLNKFKNVRTFKPTSFKVNKDVETGLRDYLEFKKEQGIDSKFLFYNVSKKIPYTSKRFGELLTRMFKLYSRDKKAINLNVLRKIKASFIEKMDVSLRMRVDLHKKMFHSGFEGMKYAKKD